MRELPDILMPQMKRDGVHSLPSKSLDDSKLQGVAHIAII